MLLRVVMGLVGAALVGCSLFMTVTYAATTADGVASYVWALVAGCVGLAKIGLPLRKPVGAKGWAALLVLWAVCFVLDTSYHSGYQNMTRGAAVEARAEQIAARAEKSRLVTELEKTERATPTPARAREVVTADLAAAERVAGECGPRRANVDVCRKVGELQVELSGWHAKERTVAELAAARAHLSAMPEIELYPEYKNLRAQARALGFDISGAAIAAGFSVLLLFIFDAVPVMALHIALTPDGPPPAPKPSRRLLVQSEEDAARVTAADVAAMIEKARKGATVPGVQRLSNGQLKIVQGQLAQAVGVSPRAVKAELVSMGAVFGSHGTFVR